MSAPHDTRNKSTTCNGVRIEDNEDCLLRYNCLKYRPHRLKESNEITWHNISAIIPCDGFIYVLRKKSEMSFSALLQLSRQRHRWVAMFGVDKR